MQRLAVGSHRMQGACVPRFRSRPADCFSKVRFVWRSYPVRETPHTAGMDFRGPATEFAFNYPYGAHLIPTVLPSPPCTCGIAYRRVLLISLHGLSRKPLRSPLCDWYTSYDGNELGKSTSESGCFLRSAGWSGREEGTPFKGLRTFT